MESQIKFQCIDHIGAPVWDADSAVALYETAGIPVVFDEVLTEYDLRTLFVDLGDLYLEFLEPVGDNRAKTFLQQRGPGYEHIAYRVTDVDHTVDLLREDGWQFQTDEPFEGVGNSRVIFFEENQTGGLQIELVDRPSGFD